MRYAAILENDMVNGEGFCVSLWVQGCPHHCKGCHNPQTWNFNCGKEESIEDIITNIIMLIKKNGVQRNFSVLGGEPLCDENVHDVLTILKHIRDFYPDIKIFLWSGYLYEELIKNDTKLSILKLSDVLIDGKFEEPLRDISLKLRGSTNQRIIDLKGTLSSNKVVLYESS